MYSYSHLQQGRPVGSYTVSQGHLSLPHSSERETSYEVKALCGWLGTWYVCVLHLRYARVDGCIG